VAEERLGYQSARVDGVRTLVYGAPLPPEETELYLFYPLADVDRTLSLLARVLVIASLAAVAAAGVLAQRVSSRILRPLAGVSTAAQRVAEGLLETRVEASTRDELGTLAASFNQMAAALQDMIRRERRFVAAVSHELRTPLAALQATGQVLARHSHELPPVAQEAAELVLEDITDLRRLVEDLLEVSELDSGRARVRWERVDLRSLAEAVVRRRRLAVPIQGPAIETFADKARLERILGNLVDNAIQHGGDEVALSLSREDGSCFVAVADRGPGISQEDLPRLFEPFFKADRSRGRDRGGIGLGLAIAQQNARLLGGEIAVRSDDGGTSFTLRLPLRPDRPDQEDGE
jgi:two-component system sensor histidine kinase MtrB